jgi:hypothetical protein
MQQVFGDLRFCTLFKRRRRPLRYLRSSAVGGERVAIGGRRRCRANTGALPYTYFCGPPKSRLPRIPYGRCPRARPYTAMHRSPVHRNAPIARTPQCTDRPYTAMPSGAHRFLRQKLLQLRQRIRIHLGLHRAKLRTAHGAKLSRFVNVGG